MMPPVLTDEEYRLFSEWLAESYGLRYGPEKRDILRARLEPRRAALGHATFEELYFHIKFHPHRREELEHMLPRLTNNESYFLRERRQLDLLIEEVLPRRLSARAGAGEVRLLSAGCGRGEEPYSLAMVLRDAGLVPSARLRISGMDLDPVALRAAEEGVFTAHSFRGVPEEVRARHFATLDEGKWRIRPALRRTVEFRRGNLVSDEWRRSLAPQDVIFCRNVLIYFDDEAVARALEQLHGALAPGGVLFLGHSESLARHPHGFRVERRPGAVFYQRPEA